MSYGAELAKERADEEKRYHVLEVTSQRLKNTETDILNYISISDDILSYISYQSLCDNQDKTSFTVSEFLAAAQLLATAEANRLAQAQLSDIEEETNNLSNLIKD